MIRALWILLPVTLVLATTAAAHQPSLGSFWSRWELAFSVEDPEVSIVVYQEVTCEHEQLWLGFDAAAGEEVWVQLGVPVIDRLADRRPTMAVVAPGLPQPDADIPFDIPEGLGLQVIPSESGPADFYEPFTQTESWVWAEAWVKTPEAGRAFVVAWYDEPMTGKVWLAMGTVEDFSEVDWADAANWGTDVASFHEVREFEDPERTDVTCATPIEPATCSTTGGTQGSLAILLSLTFLVRRRLQ